MISTCNNGIQAADAWEFAWWALIIGALLAYAVIRRWRPVPPERPLIHVEVEDDEDDDN